jgi:hypothetical protein
VHCPRRRFLALTAGLVSLIGSGFAPVLARDAHPFTALGLSEIAITITETAFEGVPAELAAGRYVLTVTNALAAGDGVLAPEASGINFLRLTDDLTAEAFIAQVGAYGAPPEDAEPAASPSAAAGATGLPAWFYEVTLPGGPYALPGETASAVIDLTAGDWVLWGEFPGAPQAPVPMTVTGEMPTTLPAVDAGIQITMVEYDFVVPPAFPTGPQVIELSNAGQQPHFFTLARVPEGTTVDEGLAAFFARFAGPDVPVAGSASAESLTIAFVQGTQSSGVTAWYTVDLAPGTYLAVCFIPDPVQGVPHVMYGMTQMIVVA